MQILVETNKLNRLLLITQLLESNWIIFVRMVLTYTYIDKIINYIRYSALNN